MKLCYPANDISSYLLTPGQAKLLSDLARTSGLGNAIPSRVASEQPEFLEVLACASLYFLCLHLCLSRPPCPCTADCPLRGSFDETVSLWQGGTLACCCCCFCCCNCLAPCRQNQISLPSFPSSPSRAKPQLLCWQQQPPRLSTSLM